MKFLSLATIAIIIITVLCAGCTSQTPSTPATPSAVTPLPATQEITAAPVLPSALAGNWELTTLAIQDGSAVTHPTTAITLSFGSDGNVSGNGGCNNYFGPYVLTGITTSKGQGITIGPLGSTKMYCQATSSQESTYLGILQKATAYNVDGTQLSITASDQNVLIFQRPSTLPSQTEGMLPA